MHCACTGGNGLAIQLCDFHARVFAARQNRLLLAAQAVYKRASAITDTALKSELDALAEALLENGADQALAAGPQYVKKAHFLLRRAYDALTWCGGADDFQKGRKAHKGWEKDIRPLIEELRKVFKPAT